MLGFPAGKTRHTTWFSHRPIRVNLRLMGDLSGEHSGSEFRTVTSTHLLNGLRDPENRTVWQEFVSRYRPLIESYARRLGMNETDAQDAAQQSLIAFCTSYQDGKYHRETGRLRHWLFGIARNQINNARKKGRRRELQIGANSGETDFFERVEDDAHLEEIWEQEWRDAVLRQCLEEVRQTVEPKSVEAFELFARKGWSAQQVADHLGMTPNAVFIAKHRIMKQIKELLPRMEAEW